MKKEYLIAFLMLITFISRAQVTQTQQQVMSSAVGNQIQNQVTSGNFSINFINSAIGSGINPYSMGLSLVSAYMQQQQNNQINEMNEKLDKILKSLEKIDKDIQEVNAKIDKLPQVFDKILVTRLSEGELQKLHTGNLSTILYCINEDFLTRNNLRGNEKIDRTRQYKLLWDNTFSIIKNENRYFEIMKIPMYLDFLSLLQNKIRRRNRAENYSEVSNYIRNNLIKELTEKITKEEEQFNKSVKAYVKSYANPLNIVCDNQPSFKMAVFSGIPDKGTPLTEINALDINYIFKFSSRYHPYAETQCWCSGGQAVWCPGCTMCPPESAHTSINNAAFAKWNTLFPQIEDGFKKTRISLIEHQNQIKSLKEVNNLINKSVFMNN